MNIIFKMIGRYYLSVVCVCALSIFVNFNIFTAETPQLIEEGWRYRATFQVDLIVRGGQIIFDRELFALHNEMALICQEALTVEKKDQNVVCLVRIVPIVYKDGKISLGNPVKLTDKLLTQGECLNHEFVFLSGFSGLGKKSPSKLFPFTVNGGMIKPNAFCSFPTYGTNKVCKEIPEFFQQPYREESSPTTMIITNRFCDFLQRTDIDPQLFERNIRFRYPENPRGTCFEGGHYKPLFDIHSQVLLNLQKRESFIKGELTAAALSYSCDILDTFFKKQISLQPLRGFNVEEKANSYGCAEQTALDFMQDARVLELLRLALDIKNSNVLGILVNIHSTQTPCTACITSIAREFQTYIVPEEYGIVEEYGVFKKISDGKPVGIICSCADHYIRKGKKIPYEATTYLQKYRMMPAYLDDMFSKNPSMVPYELDLAPGFHRYIPIPVVLLMPDESYQYFKVNIQKLDDLLKFQS